ncbi:hypothetical protein ALO82_200256 [Pseudomonas syringae pv. broussonetiae]|nr:hypothetical protein ALO82_200256 [Pseudomonas syringae pv. broussonetiae]
MVTALATLLRIRKWGLGSNGAKYQCKTCLGRSVWLERVAHPGMAL